jgi:uncharacterized membrane-anchored protein YhcB (DUF1043 family)
VTARLEATALEDAAALTDQLDEVQSSFAKEKEDVRKLLETSLKVRDCDQMIDQYQDAHSASAS